MNILRNIKFALPLLLLAAVAVSCINESEVPNSEREKISLDAWIRLNKPELLQNYQENGGYYVEVLNDGGTGEGISADGNDFGTENIMEQDTCWVFTNMTGRDINGSICVTRNGSLAEMCGTFSYYTHYVPYVNYSGNTNMGLLEGSYLAMRNELKIGEGTLKLRKGSKVRLYLPSSIGYGESGSAAEGGYEGQYALNASRPLIWDVEVLKTIKNPSDLELGMVSRFVGYESNWINAEKSEEEKKDEDKDLTLKGLYYNHSYNPDGGVLHERYIRPEEDGIYSMYSDDKKYADMESLNDTINKILLKRFGKGLSKEERNESNQVKKGGRAKVWYMLRFLDGFVVDTNIAEIRTLVFNEATPSCEVFSYSPSDDDGKDSEERSAIGAWYYCIPQMHFGAWGQIVTTSGYAYGASGISGTTTTETSSSNSSYYNALNYYNYYNSYYNYYSPYYNYYDYSYYNYNYNTSNEETTTTTTIGTEILPYTPLVFTLFVEPNE